MFNYLFSGSVRKFCSHFFSVGINKSGPHSGVVVSIAERLLLLIVTKVCAFSHTVAVLLLRNVHHTVKTKAVKATVTK